jgi:molybdenum cofactor cytidylyltransferase
VIEPQSVALLLLAAGRGARLGGGKLAADLGGKPLGLHAAEKAASLPFMVHVATCSSTTPSLDALPYKTIMVEPEGAPISRSIVLGMAAIAPLQPRAVMIILADMPFVPLQHFRDLLAAFEGQTLATRVDREQPPALFDRSLFGELLMLEGDQGAAMMLRGGPAIPLDWELSMDVDTPQDLARARAISVSRSSKI